MPTISIFYGIFIRMYYDEHRPPHFHAITGILQEAQLLKLFVLNPAQS